MNIGRASKSQSKGRSPAVQPATPRPFLPPSYYATAAAQSPTGTIRGGKTTNGDQYIDQKDNQRSRRISKARPAVLSSDSSVSSVEKPVRSKSRTPRTGYPELETQLLPSLRETVDRMTLTPSRTSPYPPIVGSSGVYEDTRRQASREHSYGSSSNHAAANSPRFPNAQKPALKSALRSPMPTAMPTPTVQSPSSQSRSTFRSLLSRKCSGTLKSPFKPAKDAKEPADEDFHTKTPTIQSRSRKNVESNIPRPHMKPDIIRLDDSDVERYYEADMRSRRKLMVANAEVPTPSASSMSDVESQRSVPVPMPPTPRRKWGKEQGSVGLGLSLPSAIPIPVQRFSSRKEEPPVAPEKTLRFSLPLSESVGSMYSDDFNFSQPNRHQNPIHTTSDTQRSSPNVPRPPIRHSRTYSVSTKTESTDDETESEREGYSVRRSRSTGNRNRSSSCEARLSFVPSSSSEDGAIPIVPPAHSRQRSPRPPSPRTARIFPENLRELIKSRNSPSTFAEATLTPTQASTRRHSPETRASKRDRLRSPNPDRNEPESTPRLLSSAVQPQERSNPWVYEASGQDHTEASAIVHGYRRAAAKERSAFGLPPSSSDEMSLSQEGQHHQLSQTDSEMSSLNQARWKDGESDELSTDTESIVRTTAYRGKDSQRNQLRHRNTPRLSVISPTLSATSSLDARYDGPLARKSPQIVPPPSHNHFEEPPKTRESVIQEIFESEEELLRLFHICMRMFILPLRAQDSRTWIAGVPPNVAKLFDWFDDIVKLHELVYESLCSARDTMSPATDRVSETLRCFVLKVEVYQPYLVRLADVSTEIMSLADAHDTDFGEFVALQHCANECEGWTLDRLLMLPVNRLAAYQDLFARMLDLTPKSHQDYLSTFSLSRSTDMVIRVMTEVKVREDEFNLLKAFSSRIQGLPMSFTLATRHRRLLHSGPVELVIAADSPSSVDSPARTGMGSRSDRGSRLLGTMSSSSSKIFEKYHSEHSTPLGDGARSKDVTNSPTPVKGNSSWFSRLRRQSRVPKSPQPAPSDHKPGSPAQPEAPLPPRTPTISIHAFVFNDLVLLAQSLRSSRSEPQWDIYHDLGVFRPLSIARLESLATGGTIVSLETMVVDPNLECLVDRIEFGPATFRTVDFLLQPSTTKPSTSFSPENEDTSLAAWLDAFRQCSWSTLRKLTFPELSPLGGLSDFTVDTQLALSSLVGSGLPLPRSPSGTFPDMYGGGDSAFRGDEREERGWWSLRYQQIFRELRRQDALLSDDDDATFS